MSDTVFRTWMTRLCEPEGNRPEWPVLLLKMFENELRRQQEVNRQYTGQRVLISRCKENYKLAESGEKKAVRGLYHRCLEESKGILTIGDERFWLLSYEVPNQGNSRMRRVDLLGLTPHGGLAVFECKLGNNSYAPVAAVLEGLDYLACLTCETNFLQLQQNFWELLDDKVPQPDGFDSVEPTSSAQHSVIVLAPQEYYDLYTRSDRGKGWKNLASCSCHSDVLKVRFAVTELDNEGYYSRQVQWQLGTEKE